MICTRPDALAAKQACLPRWVAHEAERGREGCRRGQRRMTSLVLVWDGAARNEDTVVLASMTEISCADSCSRRLDWVLLRRRQSVDSCCRVLVLIVVVRWNGWCARFPCVFVYPWLNLRLLFCFEPGAGVCLMQARAQSVERLG